MAISIKHAKTDTIADWTQADLDQQIAAGNYPPGTLLANIVLPSDWNNDHTLAGTVGIANGGTGATTATDAINALLPSQTSNTGKVLTTDGTNTSWVTNGSGTVTSVGLSAPSIFSVAGSPVTSSGTLALTYSGTALPVLNGGTGVTTSSGANSVVIRDANANITTNCLFEGFTSQAAGTLITLTASSVQNWVITGSGGQTIKLPDATTLPNGALFTFNNNQSSGTIIVQNNSSTTVATLQSGAFSTLVLLSNSIAAGSWDRHDQAPSNVSWSTNTFDYAGSITSATWNGVSIAVNRGGTGLSSLTAGYIPYGNGTSAFGNSANLQFTGSNLLIGQTYDQGTGSLQNTGTATINGNLVDKQLYLQGGNNLGLYSQDYSQASWTKNAATITTAYATAPDGTSTANRVVFTAGTTSSTQIQQTYTATLSGLTLTVSAWVKSNTGASQTFQLKLTQAGVADHYSADQTATTSWQRFTYTFTFAAGGTGAIIGVANGSDSLAKDLQVWGIQLELGSVASSYTPTTSAIVTTTNNISVPSGSITTSADSTFNTVKVGLGAGSVSTNTAVGYQSLNATTTGGANTALGYQSLRTNTTSTNNVAIGYQSLLSLTGSSGGNNMAIGPASMYNITTGQQNVGVGASSLIQGTGASFNVAIGFQSLYTNNGNSNVGVGLNTLQYNSTSSNLTAVGTSALLNNTTNVATLGSITGGSAYTAGTYTGVVMTLSSGSTATTYPTATIVVAGGAVTTVTLTSNGVGFKDTTTVLTAPAASIGGTGSGFSVPVASLASGTNNTAVGYQSLTANTVGVQNTAVGYLTASKVTTGSYNDAFGWSALLNTTTGQINTAIGRNALQANTSGNNNAALGVNALYTNNGNNNVALGVNALFLSSGANNTAIGYQAGYGPSPYTNANSTGANNTYIGYQTVGSGSGNTNEMVIGYNAVGLGSNTTVIGNSSTTLTKAFGVVTSTVYTVATLPSASTSGIGARAFVSDALAPTFGSTVTGGSSTATPVYSDGTNWKVG